MADSSTFTLDIVPEDFAVESVLYENVFIGIGIWSNYTLVLFVMLVVFGSRCRFTCPGFFPPFAGAMMVSVLSVDASDFGLICLQCASIICCSGCPFVGVTVATRCEWVLRILRTGGGGGEYVVALSNYCLFHM